MKTINNLIQNSGKIEKIEEPQSRTYNERQIRAASAVNKLFDRVFAILPAAKRSIESNDPEHPTIALGNAKAEWIAEIMESGLNQKMVELGLKKLRKRENPFMPSAGEFFALCKPSCEDLGIPTVQEAYKLACNQIRGMTAKDYPHEIVFLTGKEIGFFELAGQPSSKMMPIFKKQYEYFIAKIIRGESIGNAEKALEDNSNKPEPDPRSDEEREVDRKKAAKLALDKLMGRT